MTSLYCNDSITCNNLYVVEEGSLISGEIYAEGVSNAAQFSPEYCECTDVYLRETGVIGGGGPPGYDDCIFSFTQSSTNGMQNFDPNASFNPAVTLNIDGASGTTLLPIGNYPIVNFAGSTTELEFSKDRQYNFIDFTVSGTNFSIDNNTQLGFKNLTIGTPLDLGSGNAIKISGNFTAIDGTTGSGIINMVDATGTYSAPSSMSVTLNCFDSEVTLGSGASVTNLSLRGGTFDCDGNDILVSEDFNISDTTLSGFDGTNWSVGNNMTLNGSIGSLLNLAATSYTVDVGNKGVINYGNISGMDASSGTAIYAHGSVIN